MVKKYKIFRMIDIGENVLKKGFNFLVNEAELKHLNQ